MTPAEFKAWFDGFTEAFTGCPTKAQWARIKDRVSEIDGRPVTERVYVDRYVDRYWRMYPSWQYFGAGNAVGSTCTSLSQMQNGLQGQNNQNMGESLQSADFNGIAAMNALGRAEGASVS